MPYSTPVDTENYDYGMTIKDGTTSVFAELKIVDNPENASKEDRDALFQSMLDAVMSIPGMILIGAGRGAYYSSTLTPSEE